MEIGYGQWKNIGLQPLRLTLLIKFIARYFYFSFSFNVDEIMHDLMLSRITRTIKEKVNK